MRRRRSWAPGAVVGGHQTISDPRWPGPKCARLLLGASIALCATAAPATVSAAQPVTEATQHADAGSPGQPTPTKESKRRAESLKLAAMAKYQARDFEEAARLFLQAHQLHPRPAFLFNAARCRDKQGRYVEALQLLERFTAEERSQPRRRRALRFQRGVERRALKTHARLSVSSDPPGATVFADGSPGPEGKTPRVLWLSKGKHEVRGELEGRAPASQGVDLSAGGLHRVTLVLEPLPAPGRVRFVGLPDGARLRVRGSEVARAPLPAPLSFKPGAHTVEILHPAHQRLELPIGVSAGVEQEVRVAMTPLAPVQAPTAKAAETTRPPPPAPGHDVSPVATHDDPVLSPWSWTGIAGSSAAMVCGVTLLALAFDARQEALDYSATVGAREEHKEAGDRSDRMLIGSYVSFAVAGALGGMTALVLWRDLSQEQPASGREASSRQRTQRYQVARGVSAWLTVVPEPRGGRVVLLGSF